VGRQTINNVCTSYRYCISFHRLLSRLSYLILHNCYCNVLYFIYKTACTDNTFTSLPIMARSIAISGSFVCMSVCLSIRKHIWKARPSNSVKKIVHVACCRGTILLWRGVKLRLRYVFPVFWMTPCLHKLAFAAEIGDSKRQAFKVTHTAQHRGRGMISTIAIAIAIALFKPWFLGKIKTLNFVL